MASDAIERLKGAIELEKADEVPVIPIAGQWIAKFSGIPIEQIIHKGEKLFEGQIKAYEAVGYDILCSYCECLYTAETLGCKLNLTKTGLQLAPISIKTVEDIERIPVPSPGKDGRLPEILKTVELLSKYSSNQIPVMGAIEGPLTTALRVIEPDYLMRTIIKGKNFVLRLLEKIADILITVGEALVERGVNILFIPDPVASSSMISLKTVDEIAFPSLKRLVKSIKVPSILHICGDSTQILNMMVKTSASVLSVEQCMNLSLVREKVGWETVIGGNIDPVRVLLFGNSEDIYSEVHRCLAAGGIRRFILMTGCSISPDTPVDNLRTVVLAARKFRFA
jgi:MtaA/CmuA family methyltransferase